MICMCKKWNTNIQIINGYITMQSNMAWGNKKGYEGEPFMYCPWCGKKLIEEIKTKEKV